MAELTPYTPRSQMSMELLKAISEPKMTAQDLARQEGQERVEKFGGIRMPTQMENVFKGIEKTTGYKPYSAEQTPLDRAALAAEMIAPGIKGKAMMPAIAPLVTKAGRWFKTAPLPEYNEKLFNTELNKEMRFLNKRMRDVHDLGPHLGRDTEMGASFYDWYPNYAKTENFLAGPGGSTVQAKILGKGVRVPEVGGDYEQIGRFISNDVFEDKNLFTSWMTEYSPYVLEDGDQFIRTIQGNDVFSNAALHKIWKQLSKSTPKKDRGGYVSDLQGTGVSDGTLHPKNYLETELAKIDKQMKGLDPKSSLFKSLKIQKRARRDYLKERYVDDFGSYFKKGELMGPHWEALVHDRGLVDKFKQSMSKKGITHLKYKNTNPNETANALLGNRGSGISYQRPEFKNKTATMVLDVDALEPAWEKATGKEMLRSKTKDWFSKSGKRYQSSLWQELKDVIGR
tara:strand:+ start:38 stop:1402 length:1365 start_codon:yes stop_codon:yes gene_type:complete